LDGLIQIFFERKQNKKLRALWIKQRSTIKKLILILKHFFL
jgi:DNA polymerase sigma